AAPAPPPRAPEEAAVLVTTLVVATIGLIRKLRNRSATDRPDRPARAATGWRSVRQVARRPVPAVSAAVALAGGSVAVGTLAWC
ncbi:hypothetical protein, partial [Nocardia farcinica]